ncbi:retrovirus-related pol polyprotein from transposon TNT 1-94, partial [Tanacetum coccineum]
LMIDDEETLVLEGLNRLSEDFGKRFVPQQELSDEQAFWLQTSHPNTDQSALLLVQIEAPKELPKITPNAITEGEWGFEHAKAVFLKEIILFVKNLKDIFNVFDKDLLNEITEIQTVFNQMEAVLQAKDTTICKLKEHIKSMRENDKEENVKHEMDEIKTINSELEHKQYDSLIAQLNSKSLDNADLKGQIQEKVFVTTALQSELRRLKGKHVLDNATTITNATTIAPGMFKLDREPLSHRLKNNRGSSATDVPSSFSLVNDRLSILFSGTVRFRNDQVAKIIGYGDYQLGNVIISRVYYVEGLGHNLFSVGQFCDTDLEVSFRNTYFIRNLEGVDILSGSRDTNLYTISLDDMLKTSPICLLSKSLKTKSWLWHRHLSHLNFGKSKRSSHQPKAEDTNKEKLYLLHMDLCGLMRVESINGKKYILVIFDDYSQFIWVKFLRSKDEAPGAIIKYIKNIQVRLNATVPNVRTDNGTEFVNQTLRDFFENVGISHQTFVARTPQQNGVVKI